jgi:hypothetical protein
MLTAMGISWPSAVAARSGFVCVAVTAMDADHTLVQNILHAVEAHIGLQTSEVSLREAPPGDLPAQWFLKKARVPKDCRAGFLLFGPDAASRALGGPRRPGELRQHGRCTFLAVEALDDLSLSADAKRRLWALLCEIPKRDAPSVTFPVVD